MLHGVKSGVVINLAVLVVALWCLMVVCILHCLCELFVSTVQCIVLARQVITMSSIWYIFEVPFLMCAVISFCGVAKDGFCWIEQVEALKRGVQKLPSLPAFEADGEDEDKEGQPPPSPLLLSSSSLSEDDTE